MQERIDQVLLERKIYRKYLAELLKVIKLQACNPNNKDRDFSQSLFKSLEIADKGTQMQVARILLLIDVKSQPREVKVIRRGIRQLQERLKDIRFADEKWAIKAATFTFTREYSYLEKLQSQYYLKEGTRYFFNRKRRQIMEEFESIR